MKKTLSILTLCVVVSSLSSCALHRPKFHAPPGQVKKVTGYNPASGKFHAPPGQVKKATGYNPASGKFKKKGKR